jgi:predicted TIM-barrel fold metal-dependent hydrolase
MSIIDELDYYESVDLLIFQRELADWLPSRIFDVHTHAWLTEHTLKPIAEERVGLVFEAASVSWTELQEAYTLLFPGKSVEFLAFGMPLTVIDRQANNAYIASQTDQQTSFGLYIPSLDETAEILLMRLREGKFIGFKPYLSYVTWKPLESIRIRDFVTDAQLEVAHAYHLPIMLHVPRDQRLADLDNLTDLEYIATHYPQAHIILAHGGRAYALDLINKALDVVETLPNMYFDFSNVQSSDVIQAILERMPLEHLMYGSDIPVATVRGYMFMLNGQRVALTRKPFDWSISSTKPKQLRCTFMGYEQIRAMKHASDQLHLGAEAVEKLFYSNARSLVDNALLSLNG